MAQHRFRRHEREQDQDRRSHRDRHFDRYGHDIDAQYEVDIFALPFNLGNIASGANAQAQQTIDASYAFEWTHSTFVAELHGAAAPALEGQVPEVNIQITDTGTGKSLFYAPVPISSIAGTARQPFELPMPRLFPKSATITVTATNFSVAGTGTGANQWDAVTLVMHGRRIWERS